MKPLRCRYDDGAQPPVGQTTAEISTTTPVITARILVSPTARAVTLVEGPVVGDKLTTPESLTDHVIASRSLDLSRSR